MARWPVHQNPETQPAGKAPYNFVPLPEQVVTVDDAPPFDRYSGYTGHIDCTLSTESPLFTRAGMSPTDYAKWGDKPFHELPDDVKDRVACFFHLDKDGLPVIPGSSLRGMLRGLVEIAAYAKVQLVTDEQLIYRAVGDPSSLGSYYREQLLGENKAMPPNTFLDYPTPRLKGGYLKREGGAWVIQPAAEHLDESFVHVDYQDAQVVTEGSRGRQKTYDVFARPVRRSQSNRGRRGRGDLLLNIAVTPDIQPRQKNQTAPPGMVPGTLIESGHMEGMHAKHWHCIVYEENPDADPLPISDEKWAIYQKDRDMTRGIDARRLEDSGDALFYLLDDQGDLVFFGPTKMIRLPYERSPLELVPPELRQEEDLDLAEAIFGFVKGRSIRFEDRALSGRVQVSDAGYQSNQERIWLSQEAITPRILSSPKPTSFQHYLTQESDDRRELNHYASKTPEKTVIRGHKLYWHKGKVGIGDIQETDEEAIRHHPKQYTAIKPVNAGVTFRFRLRFENLRNFELGALLWALSLPGHKDRVYRHKIGMGKPLGMGTVHIEPRLVVSNRTDIEHGRYARLFTSPQGPELDEDEACWHLAEGNETTVDQLIERFEDYILEKMDQDERKDAQSLRDLRRIKILLRMLEWPGPDPDDAEYMDLFAFKRRLVLPDPFKVLPTEPAQTSARRSGGAGLALSDDQREPLTVEATEHITRTEHERPQAERRPRTLKDLQEGMVIEGTVKRTERYGAFVDIGVGRDGLIHISNLADRFVQRVEEIVIVGDRVRVEVLEVDVRQRRIGLKLVEVLS